MSCIAVPNSCSAVPADRIAGRCGRGLPDSANSRLALSSSGREPPRFRQSVANLPCRRIAWTGVLDKRFLAHSSYNRQVHLPVEASRLWNHGSAHRTGSSRGLPQRSRSTLLVRHPAAKTRTERQRAGLTFQD